MKTGIVMQIENGKAVVVRSDGAFLSLPAKPDWVKGAIVPIRRTQPHRTLYSIAACIAVVVTLSGIGAQAYFTQTALVSVDVNPSIELGLNRFDRVISVSARNDGGAIVVENESLRNQLCDTAVAELLNGESMSSFLSDSARVVVTVFSVNGKKQQILLDEVQQAADRTLAAHHSGVNTEYHTVSEQEIESAHAHGVTAGKYLYLQQLVEVAPDLNIEEYTHDSIEQLQGQIDACHAANAVPTQTPIAAPVQPAPKPMPAQAYGEHGGGHGGHGHE